MRAPCQVRRVLAPDASAAATSHLRPILIDGHEGLALLGAAGAVSCVQRRGPRLSFVQEPASRPSCPSLLAAVPDMPAAPRAPATPPKQRVALATGGTGAPGLSTQTVVGKASPPPAKLIISNTQTGEQR
jgi:hypothetical protein